MSAYFAYFLTISAYLALYLRGNFRISYPGSRYELTCTLVEVAPQFWAIVILFTLSEKANQCDI